MVKTDEEEVLRGLERRSNCTVQICRLSDINMKYRRADSLKVHVRVVRINADMAVQRRLRQL